MQQETTKLQPKSSNNSFRDLPVDALLEVNIDNLSNEELARFTEAVQEARVSAPTRRASTRKASKALVTGESIDDLLAI
jgi:hypothetical protein